MCSLYVTSVTHKAAFKRRRCSLARILIAEDRESMRSALRTLVELRPGWQVCGEAEDANEAIAKATELHPDLIIMAY